jgi:membrane fusion protein, copper/silver efflux system
MKAAKLVFIILLFTAVGFSAGYLYKLRRVPAPVSLVEHTAADDVPPVSSEAFQVDSRKQQLIGVRFDTVQQTANTRTIRAVGKVAMDDTRIAQVHTKIEGWINKVYVDFVGKFVRTGEPLLTIYSPEMLASQQEFLLALKARETMNDSRDSEVRGQMENLVEAARRRLELWDLSASQIDRIQESRTPIQAITLYSPASGYVTEHNAFPNAKIDSNMNLYTIVDLSRVWVVADVFEFEMTTIGPGSRATVSLPYSPGRRFRARVGYIQPSVDPMTRTLKIRLDAENPGLLLKPEMAVDVEFQLGAVTMLTIPSEALLDSGERKTVFVDLGGGYLEPRDIEIGARVGDRIEIRKGLAVGERVVSSGTFLIDSESRLRKSGASHQHNQPSHAPAKEHTHD